MERGGARLHEEEMEAMMALEMKVVRAPCLREGGRKRGKACGVKWCEPLRVMEWEVEFPQ